MTEESQKPQPNEQEKMLEEHKKMLIMTGNLSDFQLNNLKTWPFIVFDDVSKVEIEYDFSEILKDDLGEAIEGIGAGKVIFNLSAAKVPTEEQIGNLRTWTKFLFWKDTEVEVNLKV